MIKMKFPRLQEIQFNQQQSTLNMSIYEEAWKNIVRPTQIKSKINAYGPKQRIVNGKTVVRTDLSVVNRNGKQLHGFLFSCPEIVPLHTILYLHGNGGSKLQSLPLVELIPQFGVNLAAFDLPGCGNSDPEVLTYGVNQVFDIREMLQEVRRLVGAGKVVLWGRSMGSLCSIMFAQLYSYEVSALVLDSPFRSLSKVVQRIANRKVNLPSVILKPFLYFIEKRAEQQVGFDIFSIDYLSIFKKLTPHLPVLFVFSNFDSVVPAYQVLDFYNSYNGPKDLCEIYRTHDEDRPEDLFRQGLMWLTKQKKQGKRSVLQAREQLQQRRKQKQLQRAKSTQGKFTASLKQRQKCC